jgi:hypothetical protein
MRQRRIDDHNRERVAQPLTQRDGKRQAGKSGPADDNIDPWRPVFIHPRSL